MNVNAVEKLDELLSPGRLNYYNDDNLCKSIKKNVSNEAFLFDTINSFDELDSINAINKIDRQNITLVKIHTQFDVQNYRPHSFITKTSSTQSKKAKIQLGNQSNQDNLSNKKSAFKTSNTQITSSQKQRTKVFSENRLSYERSMSKESSESELDIWMKENFKCTSESSKTGNELENFESSADAVHQEQHQKGRRECITIVKISKLKEKENRQLKEQEDNLNFDLNQLIKSREIQSNSSGKLLKRKEVEFKSELLDNLVNLVVNNQQVNEYLDAQYYDKYDLIDRRDTLKRVAKFEMLNKLNNSIEQVNKYKNTCSSKNSKSSNSKIETGRVAYISKKISNINKANEKLLEELAALGSKHTGKCRALLEKKRIVFDKKQPSNEERLFSWVENRGGLLNSKNELDNLYKSSKCIHSYLRQTESTTTTINKIATNTTSRAASVPQFKTAGELKKTKKQKKKKRTLVQIEPFLKHLLVNENDDDNVEKGEEIYECLALNHLFNSFDVQSFDQLADLEEFVNCDCVDLFDLLDLDHKNDQLDRIEQSDKFVTIIELDFNDKSNQNVFLNRLDQLNSNQQPNCDLYFSSNDRIDEFFNLDNEKMYAISGVPSGLNGFNQTTSTNLLPTLGNNSTINMNNTPVMNTSVVPVVVSSVINPSILNQNVHFVTEQVLLYRQPGQKLGLALNFKNFNEDCPNNDQKIDRVFIQNVNPNSPASKAKGEKNLGYLRENDELLCIENRPVNTMSRLDCVACLRDAGNCITLLIKGARVLNSPLTRSTTTFENQPNPNSQSNMNTLKANSKRPPPPIIPPRLSTTVLSSVQKDKNTNDKPIANKSSSTANGTLTLKRPRRPTVQPPLPPCLKQTTTASSNESKNSSNSNNEISVSISSESDKKVNDSYKGCSDTVEQDHKVHSVSNVSTNNQNNAELNNFVAALNESTEMKDKELNCSLSDERLINNQIRAENGLTIANINHNKIIEDEQTGNAPKQLEQLETVVVNENNFIEDRDKSTELDNEQTINKQLNQQLNQQQTCLTPIQHQSSKPASISYAANIATSSLQLMNELNNGTNNLLNCFNSSSNNSNQNYMDILNQQQQNVRIFIIRLSVIVFVSELMRNFKVLFN